MIIRTLALALLVAVSAATASAASLPWSPATQSIATGENQATTNKFTWENEDWFHDLILLNPDAGVVTHGRGITVTNPSGRPLILPTKRKPDDVVLKTV